EGAYILVGIDYFSRFIVTKTIKDKSSKTVSDVIKEWILLGIYQKHFYPIMERIYE
ncbi:hypothetical protein M153_23390003, partial [Pseudoloma neurophilia]